MLTAVRFKQTPTDRRIHRIVGARFNAVFVEIFFFKSLFRLNFFPPGAWEGTLQHTWQTAVTQVRGKVAIGLGKLCDVRGYRSAFITLGPAVEQGPLSTLEDDSARIQNFSFSHRTAPI